MAGKTKEPKERFVQHKGESTLTYVPKENKEAIERWKEKYKKE